VEDGRKEAQTAQKTERFQSGFSQVWFLRLLRFFAAKSAGRIFRGEGVSVGHFFVSSRVFCGQRLGCYPLGTLRLPHRRRVAAKRRKRRKKRSAFRVVSARLVFCDSCAFLRLNHLGRIFRGEGVIVGRFLCHLVFFVANGLGVTR
jgi:ribosomal protein L32